MFTHHTLTTKLNRHALAKEKIAYFFFQLEGIVDKKIFDSYLLLNMFCKNFVYIISKPLEFDQMWMGWIRNDSVGRQNF